ncbi:hypothetical protein [Propionicicella superfundia]|uniref:hypothetical protein n=1 Tax=Propionicicella superfundia TaxID=348582 RepID=UPI00048D3F4E|nr:hypothetical protein [Propionicicella superfundia]
MDGPAVALSTFSNLGAWSQVNFNVVLSLDANRCVVATFQDSGEFSTAGEALPAIFPRGSTATATTITLPDGTSVTLGNTIGTAGVRLSLVEARSHHDADVPRQCEAEGDYWLIAEA